MEVFSEPVEWLPAKEIQEQQWLAETLGCLHQLLPFLLQDIPRKYSSFILLSINGLLLAATAIAGWRYYWPSLFFLQLEE